MDVIKANLFVVVFGGAVSLLSAFVVVMIVVSTQEVKALEKRVEEIKEKEDQFLKLSYRLDKANEQRAIQNRDLVTKKLQELQRNLQARYRPLDFTNHGMSALDLKQKIISDTETMQRLVDINELQTTFKPDDRFGFSAILDPRFIPSAEIPGILKQLEIYKELLKVVVDSRIQSVSRLALRQKNFKDPQPEKRDLYFFYDYDLTLVSDYQSIREFTSQINRAKYYFVIRRLTLQADDMKGSIRTFAPTPLAPRERRDDFAPPPGAMMPPGDPRFAGAMPAPAPTPAASGADTDEVNRLLEKRQRVVFDDFARVSAVMTVDYIEFLVD